MSNPDKIYRERAANDRRAKKEQKVAGRKISDQEFRESQRQLAALIPQVLKALEDAGWPGGELVMRSYERPWIIRTLTLGWLSERQVERAGWRLVTRRGGTEGWREIVYYLFADGSVSMANGAGSLLKPVPKFGSQGEHHKLIKESIVKLNTML